MKKFLFFFITLFSILWHHGYCQSLHIDSTRFITGNKPSTYIKYSIPTADKGILFTGSDGGNPGGIIPSFFDTVLNNVLIGKIDSNQQISWIKVYGGGDDDGAVSACQTSDGGYAILAETFSNNGNVTGNHGGNDIWLLRIDGSGNLLWEKCYGTALSDEPISVASTPDHGFIILGRSNGIGGDVPFHYGDMWSFDWVAIKTDSTGNVQWSKDIGGTGVEFSNGSILAVDNNYYIVSSSSSTDHDCTDTVWHIGVNTYDDYYVLKLDDTGKVLWDSSYGGSGDDAVNYAMFDNRDSTIVIVGTTSSTDFMVTGYNGGVSDMWVIKVSKNGTLIWQKAIGTPNQEAGSGICMGHNGGYIVYGGATGYIGHNDVWVVNTDNSGNEVTDKIFGGTGTDKPASIVPYLNGYAATGLSGSKVFTEGTTYGNFDTSSLNPDGGGPFISYIDTGTLSIKKISSGRNQLPVYPNPASVKVRIMMPDNASCSIAVINSMGQMIFEQKNEQHLPYIDVDIQQWASGLYLIKWQGEQGDVKTAKLIKE